MIPAVLRPGEPNTEGPAAGRPVYQTVGWALSLLLGAFFLFAPRSNLAVAEPHRLHDRQPTSASIPSLACSAAPEPRRPIRIVAAASRSGMRSAITDASSASAAETRKAAW